MKQNINGGFPINDQELEAPALTYDATVALAKETLGTHFKKAIRARRKFHGVFIYSDLPYNNPCFLSYNIEDYVVGTVPSVFSAVETAERWMKALLKTMIV